MQGAFPSGRAAVGGRAYRSNGISSRMLANLDLTRTLDPRRVTETAAHSSRRLPYPAHPNMGNLDRTVNPSMHRCPPTDGAHCACRRDG